MNCFQRILDGMNFNFDTSLASIYKSKSQQVRVMSESWITSNMFCPCCGYPHISGLVNNLPVADMICDNCGAVFELKSKEGKLGKKIPDGAYETMIERITSLTNPELFVMQYSRDLAVTHLTMIPSFFFVPEYIEKRKPLAATARRAGWIGCNILYSNFPKQGRIKIISGGEVAPAKVVVDEYRRVKGIQAKNITARGWLLDVLNCVNNVEKKDFSLAEIYSYSDILREKHAENHNIEAKIRQQLQLLRDKGFIEFLGRGKYRKL